MSTESAPQGKSPGQTREKPSELQLGRPHPIYSTVYALARACQQLCQLVADFNALLAAGTLEYVPAKHRDSLDLLYYEVDSVTQARRESRRLLEDPACREVLERLADDADQLADRIQLAGVSVVHQAHWIYRESWKEVSRAKREQRKGGGQ